MARTMLKISDDNFLAFDTKIVETVCILKLYQCDKQGQILELLIQKEIIVQENQYHYELRKAAIEQKEFVPDLSTNPEWTKLLDHNKIMKKTNKQDKQLQAITETTIGYDPLLAVIDVKYSKVPNICFSLTEKTDDRELDYVKQRKLKGFDDSETWSLSDTICHFILPRLQRFKEVKSCTPNPLTEQEWNNILNKMIIAFQLICRDKGSRIWNNEESNQIDKGLDLFREWFMHLWW